MEEASQRRPLGTHSELRGRRGVQPGRLGKQIQEQHQAWAAPPLPPQPPHLPGPPPIPLSSPSQVLSCFEFSMRMTDRSSLTTWLKRSPLCPRLRNYPVIFLMTTYSPLHSGLFLVSSQPLEQGLLRAGALGTLEEWIELLWVLLHLGLPTCSPGPLLLKVGKGKGKDPSHPVVIIKETERQRALEPTSSL